MSDAIVRRARAEEAEALSALAMRSKAHWGYSQEFLELVRPMLTFSHADLANDHVFVLEGSQAPVGMYRVLDTPPRGTLEDLWVDPDAIGSGMGRRLIEHALETAAGLGLTSLLIESDPHAEGFYLAMGATRIGQRVSASGRTLPLLTIDTVIDPGRTGRQSAAPAGLDG